MLVLSRKPGETLYIGNDITITVVKVQGNRVKIGIDAPGDYRVMRGELIDASIEFEFQHTSNGPSDDHEDDDHSWRGERRSYARLATAR